MLHLFQICWQKFINSLLIINYKLLISLGNRIFEVLRSSQMTCYTFYFSFIRCDTLWYILSHPSKLGMVFTPYCTFHNLLKNSFQESNWKPIQKSVQKSICNSVGNFIPKSIQKMQNAWKNMTKYQSKERTCLNYRFLNSQTFS